MLHFKRLMDTNTLAITPGKEDPHVTNNSTEIIFAPPLDPLTFFESLEVIDQMGIWGKERDTRVKTGPSPYPPPLLPRMEDAGPRT